MNIFQKAKGVVWWQEQTDTIKTPTAPNIEPAVDALRAWPLFRNHPELHDAFLAGFRSLKDPRWLRFVPTRGPELEAFSAGCRAARNFRFLA